MARLLPGSLARVPRRIRMGKRSLTAALLALLIGAMTVPTGVSAAPATTVYVGHVQHVMHPTDGQGDSPLVP